jgi:hypothetical protein
MVTTVDETGQDPERMHVGDRARVVVERMRPAVTGSPYLPMRVFVLLVLLSAAVAFAPLPISAMGVVAVVLLALDIGRHRR